MKLKAVADRERSAAGRGQVRPDPGAVRLQHDEEVFLLPAHDLEERARSLDDRGGALR